MKWAQLALLTAAVAVPSSGCGTVCNLAGKDPDNFGGVQRDVQFANDAGARGGLLAGTNTNRAAESGKNSGAGVLALAILGVYAADLSLCCVADTLTLPLVIYLRQRHEGATGGGDGPVG